MFCHTKYRDLIVQFLNNVSLKRIIIITLYLYSRSNVYIVYVYTRTYNIILRLPLTRETVYIGTYIVDK